MMNRCGLKYNKYYCKETLSTDINSHVHIKFVDTQLLLITSPGVDFTKGFKTWHKFNTEIRFMLIPIIVLFIAHEFITGKF